MPKLPVIDTAGKEVSTVELSDAVFGIEPNTTAMHLMVISFLANQRQGTQSTLTRSEVHGGGRKPWRQKGTGRARQGSTRAPHFTHGGIAFGPKPRAYGISVNKKVRRLAMKSALSSKVQDQDLLIVNQMELSEIKTREVVSMLKTMDVTRKALIVVPDKNEILYKSARNIEGVKVAMVHSLNVYDILNADKLIVLQDAVSKIEEVYA